MDCADRVVKVISSIPLRKVGRNWGIGNIFLIIYISHARGRTNASRETLKCAASFRMTFLDNPKNVGKTACLRDIA